MLGPGNLDTRLVLEAPVETPDGQGGVTRGYATVATLWAQVTPATPREAVDAAALGATITHRIVTRANFDITPRHRLREGTRIYQVLGVRDVHTQRFREVLAALRDE